MGKFIRQILFFSLPVIVLFLTVIYIDFFKIFGFQDYYSNQKVGLNRGVVTTSTYNNFREKEKYNSFIFGSSRSQAFKCKNWAKYLESEARPFHFDASSESAWGISKKMAYIDELGDTIKNALIIIDRSTLTKINQSDNHLLISMPCISKSTHIEYYWCFISASLNPKFLTAYIDYSIFNKYRPYMEALIKKSKYDHTVDITNCDIWYGWDREIESDSTEYYNKLINKGLFYKRPKKDIIECPVSLKEETQLRNIKTILTKHNTRYKIVISPLYDQIPMEKAQINLLERIFGKEHIYNFSGVNQLTEPIYNFYETSHYRPHIANEILSIIYNTH